MNGGNFGSRVFLGWLLVTASVWGAGFTLTNELVVLEVDARGWSVKLTERSSARVLADGQVPMVRPFVPGKGQLISTSVEARGNGAWAWRYSGVPGEAVVAVEPFWGGWTFTLKEMTVPGATRVELACVRGLKCCKWTGGHSSHAVSDELSGVAVRTYDLLCEGACGADVSGIVYPGADGGFSGGRVGFAAGPRVEWLKALRAMTLASGMPHSAAGGAWALESPQTKGSYLNANVTAASVDDWIDLARRGGFDVIHFRERWYACRGHYPVNTNDWPNGLADMKAAVAKIHAAGLKAGLHTLTGCIDPKDPWITPRCSHDLMAWRTFTLASPLTDASRELMVEELPGPSHDVTFTYHGSGNAIRLGDEIVQYTGIRREKPYAFTGITRGAFGTVRSDHAVGEKADYLQQRYIAFYPKPDSALALELAEAIGNVYRTCGFDQIYCDGAEGMFTRYAQAKMRHLILAACTRDGRPCLTEDSASGSGPACWWFHSRVGAWDSTYWAPKRFHDFHVGWMRRQQVREKDLREIQMGWWCPVEYSPHARPHTVDEMEYYAGKNAALNASMSIAGCNVSAGPLTFGVARQMTVLGWYERFRRAGAFLPELVEHLAVPRAEARLRQGPDGSWRAAELVTHRHRVGTVEESAWQVKLAERPAKTFLRIEALYGALTGSGTETQAMTALAAGAPEMLVVTAATQVAASVKCVKDPEQGEVLAFTASNHAERARGAWAAAAREFRPYQAIGSRRVLTFRVKGDGSGALLNVQVKTPREYGLCYSEHYVRLDFTGWRTMEMPFRETDAEEFGDLQWPYSGGYAEVFHRAINMNNVSAVTLYLNELPPKGSATALVTDVKLVPMAELAFAESMVMVNGRRLTIPFTLKSGEFAELEDGWWTHLDLFRTPKARVRATEDIELAAGKNDVVFTAGKMADRAPWVWRKEAEFNGWHARRTQEPVRAEVAFFTVGQERQALREFSQLSPESRQLLSYEAAEPCYFAPERGFAALPPLVTRQGEKAAVGFTVVGPIGPFELAIGEETKSFPAVAAGKVYRTPDKVFEAFSGSREVKVKAPAGAAARFEFVKRYDL